MADRQIGLWDAEIVADDAAKRMARASHPDTSHDAATELVASGTLTKREQQTLELVREFPDLTAQELKRAGGVTWDPHKRLSALATKGKVRRSSKRRCDVTGSMVQTWRAMFAGD